MRQLPPDVAPYRSTPTFDEGSVPAGLQRAHCTKPGVWGRIVIEEGELLYRILASGQEQRLSRDCHGIIEPEVLHEVAVVGPVRFRVEFLK